MYDKEEIYDKEIAPLMQQIFEVCKREQLPMAAQFFLKEEREAGVYQGQPMFCTTVLSFKGESEGHEQIKYVAEAMKYGRAGKPFVAAFTVRNG